MITLWGRNNSTNVKKVLWTLEELDLPFNQIMAGMWFGVNKEADYLAMNPNGWCRCCAMMKPTRRFGNPTPLSVTSPPSTVRAACGLKARPVAPEGEKWMDWANQTLSPTHRVILMGLVRTPEAERDYPAIHAAQDACENLFAMMDDELAKHAWFSGEAFGVGDIAVAPFVWNLTNLGLKWTPRPHLERWLKQLSDRPAYRNVVMIPVT